MKNHGDWASRTEKWSKRACCRAAFLFPIEGTVQASSVLFPIAMALHVQGLADYSAPPPLMTT